MFKSDFLILINSIRGSDMQAAVDPVMPKTIKIITSWELDLIPYFNLNLLNIT